MRRFVVGEPDEGVLSPAPGLSCELVMDYTRFYTQNSEGNIVMVTR